MKPDFTIGDRVRMTALGASRCMRLADRMGTIVGRSIYTNSFSVRFDGNKSSSTLHRDYLEVIDNADLVNARTRPECAASHPQRRQGTQFAMTRGRRRSR